MKHELTEEQRYNMELRYHAVKACGWSSGGSLLKKQEEYFYSQLKEADNGLLFDDADDGPGVYFNVDEGPEFAGEIEFDMNLVRADKLWMFKDLQRFAENNHVVINEPNELPKDSKELEQAMRLAGCFDPERELNPPSSSPKCDPGDNTKDPERSYRFNLVNRGMGEEQQTPENKQNDKPGKRNRQNDNSNDRSPDEFIRETVTVNGETYLRWNKWEEEEKEHILGEQAQDTRAVEITIAGYGVFKPVLAGERLGKLDFVKIEHFKSEDEAKQRAKELTEATRLYHVAKASHTKSKVWVDKKSITRLYKGWSRVWPNSWTKDVLKADKTRKNEEFADETLPCLKARRAIAEIVTAAPKEIKEPKKTSIREIKLTPFYESIKLGEMWGYWSTWELLDKNLRPVAHNRVAAIPELCNRATRFDWINKIKKDIDEENIILRGVELLPWGDLAVRVLWPVPADMHGPYGLRYLGIQVMPSAPWKGDKGSTITINGLLETMTQLVKESSNKQQLTKETRFWLAHRRELLAQLRREKLKNEISTTRLARDLIQKLKDAPKPELPTGKKYTQEEREMLTLDLVDPSKKLVCEICGKRIKKDRLELALYLKKGYGDPTHTLLKRCTRKVWKNGKQKTLFCNGSDLVHEGVA